MFLDDLVLAGDIVRESGEAAGQPDIAVGRGKKGAMPGRRGLGLALLIAGIAGFLLILGGLAFTLMAAAAVSLFARRLQARRAAADPPPTGPSF